MFRNNIIQSYVLYDIVKTGTNIFIKMEQNTKPAESESDMEFFFNTWIKHNGIVIL